MTKANEDQKKKMEGMNNIVLLCIGIVEREKAGKGPENPETLRRLLDSHKDMLIFTTNTLKEKTKTEEDRAVCVTLEELFQKFDQDSLKSANRLISRMIGE